MLLDTHVMLWLVTVPDRIGPACRQAISDAPLVYVSAITHAELAVKAGIGKIELPEGLATLLTAQGLAHLAFSERHAAGIGELPALTHHDPFDRMLLAQAQAEGLAFATADSRLLSLSLPWVMNARS